MTTSVGPNPRDIRAGYNRIWVLRSTKSTATVVRLNTSSGAKVGNAISIPLRTTVDVVVRSWPIPQAFTVADSALWMVTPNQQTAPEAQPVQPEDPGEPRRGRGDRGDGGTLRLSYGAGSLWLSQATPNDLGQINKISPSSGLVKGAVSEVAGETLPPGANPRRGELRRGSGLGDRRGRVGLHDPAVGSAGVSHDARIETARLVLRPPRVEDFGAWADFMADAKAARFIGGPMSRPVAWRGFLTVAGAWSIQGFGMFSVIERETGLWVGRLGPWMPEGWPGPEVGYGIVRSRWGLGYATEGAAAAIDWALDALGWSEVIHCIDPANGASIRVAERLGARRRGWGRLPPPLDAPVEIWGQTGAEWRARRRADGPRGE